MIWILGAIIFLLTAWLVYRFWPKGNLVHELLHLPELQYRLQTAPKAKYQKHRFGPHRRQYLLFCPGEAPEAGKAVIFYHHGGGWTFGSPEMFLATARFFNELGYPVLLPSYRRLPQFRFALIRSDLTEGYRKGLEVLEDAGMGDRRIILCGTSAGGNLVALLLYDRARLEAAGLSADRFAGIMLFGAPLDLSAMKPTPVIWLYAGTAAQASFGAASPIEYLGEQLPDCPVLCVHGRKDGLVQFPAADNFVRQLLKMRPKQVTYIPLENGTHLESARWAFENDPVRSNIKQWLNELEPFQLPDD